MFKRSERILRVTWLLILLIVSPSVVLADSPLIDSSAILINRKYTKKFQNASLVKAELFNSGIGFVEFSSASAIKIRLGQKAQSRLVRLESEGQNPCRIYRRLSLKQNRKIEKGEKVGNLSRFLSFSLNRCSPDFQVKAEIYPDDNYFQDPYLWGMKDGVAGSGAVNAWNYTTGSKNVAVVIIDTGIAVLHPDLIANLGVNPGEIADNGIDDDNNGYIDDVNGINAITSSGNPNDDNGHGTHTAGTIGAVGNNTSGVAGINWNISLYGCKFLSSSGSGFTSNAVLCVDWATKLKTDNGVDIIATNNSWGGGGYSSALDAAIARANDAGILFVASAGNRAANIDVTPTYPATYDQDNIISVAAIDIQGNLASFSNFAAIAVDIAAPGVEILSTYPSRGESSINYTYGYMSGTSMAAPHVTGALGLLASVNSSLRGASLKGALLDNAGTLTSLNGKVHNSAYLRVDSSMAAIAVMPSPSPSPTVEPSPSPSITPTPTPTPVISPSPNPTVSPTPKRKKKIKPTPTPKPKKRKKI
ncbi:MAG: S8 family peptidase [bacterium]|nr:S8 family peptidase [bacterium]